DGVLRFKIVGIGRGPMPIQCRTYLLISHIALLHSARIQRPFRAMTGLIHCARRSQRAAKKLHFQPEEVNASIPASAHSTSCSSVAPPTPSAPSTWPARMMGRPPGRLISGAPSPMTVAARKYSEPSIDSSPLGRPDLAEANAFPIDARLAS